ncbi:uncharacterized protein MELLADRAFT_41213, partial [Melampsora larici-populina 98AG31]
SLQWTSSVLLTLGVSLVQLQPSLSTKSSHHKLNDGQDWLKGLIAIICSCLSSGLAGCYFEKLVKDQSSQTAQPLSNALWAKNLQLSFCTIPFAFLAIYLDPRAYIEVTKRGFFCGYSTLVWSVIMYHALGGILVSIIVTQSSTVTKSFANSLSIVCKLKIHLSEVIKSSISAKPNHTEFFS